jgi:hypothetical protein
MYGITPYPLANRHFDRDVHQFGDGPLRKLRFAFPEAALESRNWFLSSSRTTS